MVSWSLLIGAALSCLPSTLAAPPRGHVVHEERFSTSRLWQKRDRIEQHAILPVRVGLAQSNLDQGYDHLMDVSDPDSPNYGKHWTSDDVVAKFAPSDETINAVKDWLVSAGISLDRIIHHDNKGWFAFDARADELEGLLHSQYHEYEHEEGLISVGCDKYHIPHTLQPHIDYITPGVKLSVPLKKRRVNRNAKRCRGACEKPFRELPIPTDDEDDDANLANCAKRVTPPCIRALYQIPLPNFKTPNPNNTFGIYETGDYYAQGDLNRFFKHHAPHIPQGTGPVLKSVDGGKAPVPLHQAGGESDLDFEIAFPIVYPQKIWLYQVDDKYYASLNSGDSRSGQFNTWLDAMDGSYCHYSAFGEKGDDPKLDPHYPDPRKGGYKGKVECGIYKPAKVISVSYGVQENDLPAFYQKRQCNEFMKLGLQGISIFVASGDTGVAGVEGKIDNPDFPNGCLGKYGRKFNPTEPNSCGYVINVGATEIAPGNSPHDPEVAVNTNFDYYSSGGFSNLFPRPKYQDAAIEAYFKNHNPPYPYYEKFGYDHFNRSKGRYNRIGRGIPDVAANGKNIATYFRGTYGVEDGTSASSPMFAAIISRINEERLNRGKSTVGFINPVIYKHPEILNDITSGSNPGCGTDGFKAVRGWDPVTGLGTPNYPRMRKFFLSLP